MRRDSTWRSTLRGGAPVFFRMGYVRALLDVSLFRVVFAPNRRAPEARIPTLADNTRSRDLNSEWQDDATRA